MGLVTTSLGAEANRDKIMNLSDEKLKSYIMVLKNQMCLYKK